MSFGFRANGTFRPHDPNHDIKWARGAGTRLWDTSGNAFLDCVCGYSANVLGHCHPDLIAVLADQASTLAFTTGGESLVRAEFEESICSLVSASERNSTLSAKSAPALKAWLSTTGARAVEIAWRIAFARKPGGLATFDLGYHGRSIATSYVSDTAQQDCLMTGRSTPVRFSIPFPRTESDSPLTLQESCERSLEVFQELLVRHGSQISALLIEPALGSRGYFFAPAGFFQSLTSMARSHGLLVISDEIQMGLGRLGALIASHMQGWEPDLLILGKALGGGLVPVSCVIGHAVLLDLLPGGVESETFAGSPLVCRIAIESLRLLNSTDVIRHSQSLHDRLRTSLATVLPQDSVVGVGSATAIDLRSAMTSLITQGDYKSRFSVNELATKSAYRMAGLLREKRILVHVTGSRRDRIAIIPPLNIHPDEMSEVEKTCLHIWPRTIEEMFP